MRKRILALVLALTVSLCPVMTADAAMIVKNNMGALYTSNILDKNKTEIPKDSLQKIAAGYKINYSAEDLEALKKIFDVNIYAKAILMLPRHMEMTGRLFGIIILPMD